jgi:hypothetical protein
MNMLMALTTWLMSRRPERDERGLVTLEYLKWVIGLMIGLPVIIALVYAALKGLGVNISSALTN